MMSRKFFWVFRPPPCPRLRLIDSPKSTQPHYHVLDNPLPLSCVTSFEDVPHYIGSQISLEVNFSHFNSLNDSWLECVPCELLLSRIECHVALSLTDAKMLKDLKRLDAYMYSISLSSCVPLVLTQDRCWSEPYWLSFYVSYTFICHHGQMRNSLPLQSASITLSQGLPVNFVQVP